jgi:hypothetical protein
MVELWAILVAAVLNMVAEHKILHQQRTEVSASIHPQLLLTSLEMPNKAEGPFTNSS